jgi:hypothetical protein
MTMCFENKMHRSSKQFTFSNKNNIEELFYSFRTHLWLKERQCFVRCDFSPSQSRSNSTIFIPYLIPLGNLFIQINVYRNRLVLMIKTIGHMIV